MDLLNWLGDHDHNTVIIRNPHRELDREELLSQLLNHPPQNFFQVLALDHFGHPVTETVIPTHPYHLALEEGEA